MLGEDKICAAGVRPPHHRYLQVWELQTGVGGGDLRIAPFRDLAEKDIRIDVAQESEVLRVAGKVVGQNDLAGGNRQQHDAIRDLGDFFIGHRCIAAGKVDRAIGKVLDPGTATLGLIIYGYAVVLFAEILEPSRIDRKWKASSGTDQLHILSCYFAGRNRYGGDNGRAARGARQYI